MGVVSGIVLSYQFGTNWSRFSVVVGNVIGPLIGYEVLTAFFLEASFLGVMLFGWQRVPPWLHVLSAIIVAVGTAISAFWILSANSWMQTPAGHEVRDGIAYPVDWLAIIFNPSFPYRFAHMLTAAYLTTSLVVLAVGARYLLAGRHGEESRTMLHMGIGMLALLAPIQALHRRPARPQYARASADQDRRDGRRTGTAASRASWCCSPGRTRRRNRTSIEIAIPHAGSLILTHSFDGLYPGLKSVPPQRPAAGRAGVLRLPHHGRHRVPADRDRLGRRLAVVARQARYDALVSVAGGARLVARLRRGTGRLGRHRKRTAAMGGARHPAHRRRDFAGARRRASLRRWRCSSLVYGVVFTMGIYYINRLIVQGPEGAAIEPPDMRAPRARYRRRRRPGAKRSRRTLTQGSDTWNGISR